MPRPTRLPRAARCRRARRGRGPGGGSGNRPKPLYTKAGGEKLAANPLYDYVFLNLEGSYDSAAVKAIADGLRSRHAAAARALIVRIPAFHEDPAAARVRVREIVAAGGDGVTFPHVETLDEAKQILAVFQAGEDQRLVAGQPEGRQAGDDDARGSGARSRRPPSSPT